MDDDAMILLALDPSSVAIGWAVGRMPDGFHSLQVVDAGAFHASRSWPLTKRVQTMADAFAVFLVDLRASAEKSGDKIEVALEWPQRRGRENSKVSVAMGYAVSAAERALWQARLEACWKPTPSEWTGGERRSARATRVRCC